MTTPTMMMMLVQHWIRPVIIRNPQSLPFPCRRRRRRGGCYIPGVVNSMIRCRVLLRPTIENRQHRAQPGTPLLPTMTDWYHSST